MEGIQEKKDKNKDSTQMGWGTGYGTRLICIYFMECEGSHLPSCVLSINNYRARATLSEPVNLVVQDGKWDHRWYHEEVDLSCQYCVDRVQSHNTVLDPCASSFNFELSINELKKTMGLCPVYRSIRKSPGLGGSVLPDFTLLLT